MSCVQARMGCSSANWCDLDGVPGLHTGTRKVCGASGARWGALALQLRKRFVLRDAGWVLLPELRRVATWFLTLR